MEIDEYIKKLEDDIYKVYIKVLRAEEIIDHCKRKYKFDMFLVKRKYRDAKYKEKINFKYGVGKFRDRYKKYKAAMESIKIAGPQEINDLKETDLKEIRQAKEEFEALKAKYESLGKEYAAALKKRDRLRKNNRR